MSSASEPTALVLHPSQSAKRRRQPSHDSVSPPSPRPKKKQKNKETAKERRTRRSKTKLTKGDIPDDYKGTKVQCLICSYSQGSFMVQRAFELHICLLAGIHSQRTVMPQPTIQNIGRFSELFRDHDAVFAARLGPSRLEKSAMMGISSLRAKHNTSQIARDIAQIEDHNLHQILLQLSRYGISAWCPNYEQSPYSVYNSAMRAIALDTFKQAVAAHAYMFLDIAMPVDDTAMLTRLYDNYVHDYHQKKYKKELNAPGAVVESIKNTNALRRREDLGEKRGEQLRLDGYPERAVALFEDPNCNSEDEEAIVDGRKVYKIKKKHFRSEHITRFARWIDLRRLSRLEASGVDTRGAQERLRISPAQPEEPRITTLPAATSLDWFDPDLFNCLPTSVRARYAHQPRIGLPADPTQWDRFPAGDWKSMNDKDFMAAYGDQILEKYAIPSSGELKNIAVNMKNSPRRGIKVPNFAMDSDEYDEESFVAKYAAKDKGKGKASSGGQRGSAGSGRASGSKVRVEELSDSGGSGDN